MLVDSLIHKVDVNLPKKTQLLESTSSTTSKAPEE
jgi:hypothetical protein